MGRALAARKLIEELKKRVHLAEENKKKLISYLQDLKNQYIDRQLTYSEYEEILEQKFSGKTIQEWFDFYNSYIKECQTRIKEEENKIVIKKIFTVFSLIFVISFLFIIAFYVRPSLIGYVVKEEGYSETLNLEFTQSQEYEWIPQYQGVLNSLKISGLIEGDGEVKIYLDNLLILDSSNIKEKSKAKPGITGFAIEEAPQSSPSQEEILLINETNLTTETAQEQGTEPTQPTSQPQENITEQETPLTITREFSDICEETCNLKQFNLNKSSYTLKIEISNAKLKIEKITYELAQEIPAPEVPAEENITIPETPEVNITIPTPENITGENITFIQEPAEINKPVRWKARIIARNIREAENSVPKIATITSSQQVDLELFELDYETPAPQSFEQETARGKRITISGAETLHYENVLAFTQLPKETSIEKIRLYRTTNNIREQVSFTSYDLNNNSLIDYIEWIILSLSEQTYELEILIYDAEHLNKKREFVQNIFEYVNETDSITYTIPKNEFVRAYFEKNLSSENFIDIYTYNTEPAAIEVYERDSNEIIGNINNVLTGKYYIQINYSGSNYIFDLKSVSKPVEYDYIHDGQPGPNEFNATSPMDYPDPINQGQNITFITTATSTKNYKYYLDICDSASTSITCNVQNPTGTCSGTKLCESTLTNSGSQASCPFNTTGQSGAINYRAYTCNDNKDSATAASNPYTYTVNTPEDNTPPYFTDISANISFAYNSKRISVDFNATDNVAVSSFQINYTEKFSIDAGTGVLENITSLGGGTYLINVSVNDTSNNFGFLIYSVQVNQTNTTLSLSSSPSWSEIYGTSTTITGANCPTGLSCSLTRNSSSVANPHTDTLGAGQWLYNFSTSGNENYTGNSTFNFLNISRAGGNVTVYINGSSKNATITSGMKIWLNATLITGLGNIYLYNNGSLINNASSSPAVNYTNFTNLGDFNITAYYIGNDNYSANWSYSFYVNVTQTITNTPPQIIYVQNESFVSGVDPLEESTREIQLNITVYDENGFGDINDNSVNINFTNSGITRVNTSCTQIIDFATNYANYSCTVNMWYFDSIGKWNITAYAEDSYAEKASNITTSFSYNQLQSIKISPNAISFANAAIGSTNITSINPTTINNTGNYNASTKVAFNAINLLGETTTSDFINVKNFSIDFDTGGSPPGECNGTLLTNGTDVTFTWSVLEAGNLSASQAQEQLYYCINLIPATISSQTYSTLNGGSWTIKILLALVFIPRKRKKKLAKDDKLVKALILITDELKQEYSLNKKELIEVLVEKLREKYNLTQEEILSLIKEEEIPVTIFSRKLGALESLVKYMKENLGKSYHEIAVLLLRDDRTIWTAYNKAIKKMPEKIEPKETDMNIPISNFKTKLTVLESLILHLKEKGLRNKEIAKLIERDARNISTIYSRAIKKTRKKDL